jgi:hypothetical protein
VLFAAIGFGWVKDERTPWRHGTQCLAGAGRHCRHIAAQWSRLIRKAGRVVFWRWPKSSLLPQGAGPVDFIRGTAPSDTRAS